MAFARDKKKQQQTTTNKQDLIIEFAVCFVLQKGALGMVGKELKGRAGRAERGNELSGYANPISRIFCTRPIQKQ